MHRAKKNGETCRKTVVLVEKNVCVCGRFNKLSFTFHLNKIIYIVLPCESKSRVRLHYAKTEISLSGVVL